MTYHDMSWTITRLLPKAAVSLSVTRSAVVVNDN